MADSIVRFDPFSGLGSLWREQDGSTVQKRVREVTVPFTKAATPRRITIGAGT